LEPLDGAGLQVAAELAIPAMRFGPWEIGGGISAEANRGMWKR